MYAALTRRTSVKVHNVRAHEVFLIITHAPSPLMRVFSVNTNRVAHLSIQSSQAQLPLLDHNAPHLAQAVLEAV
jgi:hypothetical protein